MVRHEDCNESCMLSRYVLHITTAVCGRVQIQLQHRCAASRFLTLHHSLDPVLEPVLDPSS